MSAREEARDALEHIPNMGRADLGRVVDLVWLCIENEILEQAARNIEASADERREYPATAAAKAYLDGMREAARMLKEMRQ